MPPLHINMKFPSYVGVVTVYGNLLATHSCYVVAMKGKRAVQQISLDDIAPPTENKLEPDDVVQDSF